jgi:hypothetical protein
MAEAKDNGEKLLKIAKLSDSGIVSNINTFAKASISN